MQIGPSFLQQHWLPRRPGVLRKHVDAATLEKSGIAKVLAHCIDPVKADLYFGNDSPGAADRMRLPRIHEAPALYRRLCATARQQILYFFGLGKVSADFAALQDQFRFGYDWRFYDQLGSLSLPGSIIHIHIDLIDTMIIQLEGTRRWQVWAPSTDVARLIALSNSAPFAMLEAEGATLMDIDLEAGDVLYIPALYPHQALLDVEAKPSLSLSVGWATLTPIRILRATIDSERRARLEALFEENPRPYLALMSDPEPGKDPITHLADQVQALLSPAQCVGLDRMDLIHRLGTLNLGELASAAGPGSFQQWREQQALAGQAAANAA